MAQTQIDEIFAFIDQTTEKLQKFLNVPYRGALSESIFNIIEQKTHIEDGYPTKDQTQELNKLYQNFELRNYPVWDVKHAIELTIIKSQKVDHLDVNLLMTPDIIGTLSALVIAEIFRYYPNPQLETMDAAIGTGNLLIEANRELQKSTRLHLSMHGIDNDYHSLEIASALGEVLQNKIDLYHQDAVSNWLHNGYDLILSDLPIGYYPLDENSNNFQTKAAKGHSYAHHLLMEQAMQNVHPSGIGLFIVPSQIFETKQAQNLAHWMVTSVYLQAVLSLPQSLFASPQAAKSLLVLQRHGANAQQSKEVLMGQIPDLKDTSAIIKFKDQLQDWTKKTFVWEK